MVLQREKEFQKLQKQWYKKLKEDGFSDIEDWEFDRKFFAVNPQLTSSSYSSIKYAKADYRTLTSNWMRLARFFYWDFKWEKIKIDNIVSNDVLKDILWDMTQEGLTHTACYKKHEALHTRSCLRRAMNKVKVLIYLYILEYEEEDDLNMYNMQPNGMIERDYDDDKD